MPPKKAKAVGTPARQPASKPTETKCDFCHAAIVEGKEDALQCVKELAKCGFIGPALACP